MQDQSEDNEEIGRLLVKEGVIDERQLEQALTEQEHQIKYRPLGQILSELGFVPRQTLHDVLLKYRKQIPLGKLLMKMGVVSDGQLAQALKAQAYSKKKLGQILVDWGFVTRARLVDAICVQLGVSGVDLGVGLPDQDLLNKVSSAFLRKKGIMPLRYDEGQRAVTVLMEDPGDSETITDLRKIFKVDLVPVMLRTDSVDHLIDELFDVWHSSR